MKVIRNANSSTINTQYEYTRQTNSKGQVTIPASIRKRMHLAPKGKIAFRLTREAVEIHPAESTLEASYGSIKPLHKPEDFDKLIKQAREEHSGKVAREV